MIEKIPFETENIHYNDKILDVQTHASPYDLQIKINELVDAVNELQKDREEIKEWIAIVGDLRSRVPVVESRVSILEEYAHPTAKTPDYDYTNDIAEVKNENLYTKSMRMDKEFAEEEMERLQKKLDRAMWWLKEIVNNHRFTPITTAEMALKELNKKTSVWDIQDYLKSNEDLANFLESALEENDYDFLKIAVNDVITALRKKENNNE